MPNHNPNQASKTCGASCTLRCPARARRHSICVKEDHNVSRRISNPPPAHGGVPGPMGLVLLLTLLLVAAGCSERPDEPGSTTHEKSWSDPGSGDFHGEFVTRQGTGSCLSLIHI